MAGQIKGITIEFRGDTSSLDKALKKINSETRATGKELKNVDRALKFNPTNIDLWRQKQQLLNERVAETREKLDVLKEAQKKMDADGVEKTSAEYRNLQREIIETESKLSKFEADLQKVGNVKLRALTEQIKQVGEKTKQVGDGIKNVGEGMTKYVTGPIVAGATASVVAFKEVDAGLDIITKKTGASGAALESMKQSAESLAKEIPTDFETAGAAIGEVNTRFGLTGKELEDLSGQFIEFAKLNDTDVSTSIDNVQKAMAAFNVPAEEAGSMLDLLNKVGQDTGISMDDLSASLVKNAPQLQALGLTANQAATFLGQLEVSGVDSTKVMTGLNKAIVAGAKEGKALPEVINDIQTSIVGAASETEAMNAASEIFGAKAGPAIATAARSGALDFQALTSAVTDADGSVSKTFEDTLDPADKFQLTLNQLKITGYEVGRVLLELIAPAIQKVGDFLTKLAEKWQGLSPAAQKTILVIGGIVAAIGPVLVVIGSLITQIGMLLTFAPALAGALPAVGAAFSALLGPVGLVIAAIAAAIAIGVALYKNWDKIKSAAAKLKKSVVDTFTAMKNRVKEIFTNLKDGMVKPIQKAKDLIKGIIDKIKSIMDFKFKLPHIKLPHFSIQPPGWNLGDLLQGQIPSLGIDWYAQGGIFDSPRMIGVGEAGPEGVIPLDPFWDKMDKIVAAVEAGSGETVINIYAQPGMDARQIAMEVQKVLVRQQKQKERAFA